MKYSFLLLLVVATNLLASEYTQRQEECDTHSVMPAKSSYNCTCLYEGSKQISCHRSWDMSFYLGTVMLSKVVNNTNIELDNSNFKINELDNRIKSLESRIFDTVETRLSLMQSIILGKINDMPKPKEWTQKSYKDFKFQLINEIQENLKNQ